MKSICIKTNNMNSLKYLLNEINNIDLKNICFSQKQFKHYNNIIIHYNGPDTTLFIKKICNILSFLILDEIEESLLNKLISQNYFYFDLNEKREILNLCFDINNTEFSYFFDKKFETIYNSFFKYFSENKSLVLDGFINFRLYDYLKILDEIVTNSVNQYVVNKEYSEFISLLKLYINSQNSSCNLVHLIYLEDESILLNENKEIINISKEVFNAKYLSDISFSSNDFILNTLLSLLPKKIYIHLSDNYQNEFINTLQNIFENKISLCHNCEICNLYKISKNSIDSNNSY